MTNPFEKGIPSLFIVGSPFQALCAIEAIHSFEINEYKVEMVKKKINPNSRRKRMSIWNFGELEITYEKKQCKSYILFEQNEIMEKNETPFDDSLYSNKE